MQWKPYRPANFSRPPTARAAKALDAVQGPTPYTQGAGMSDPLKELHYMAELARIDTENDTKAAKPADAVKNPAHYTQGKIEVWDFIADQDLGFLAGNVIKYVCRYRHKGNPKQDLLKARAYMDKLIGSL